MQLVASLFVLSIATLLSYYVFYSNLVFLKNINSIISTPLNIVEYDHASNFSPFLFYDIFFFFDDLLLRWSDLASPFLIIRVSISPMIEFNISFFRNIYSYRCIFY